MSSTSPSISKSEREDLQRLISPKTFVERDNWMRALLASDLPDAAVRIAVVIGLHLRVNTGRCNPSYPTLAAESHISERSAYRLVDLLEHRGWIAATRRSGSFNQYTLLTPDRVMTGVTPAKALTGVNTSPLPKPCQGYPCQSSEMGTPANMLAVEKRSKRTKKERKKSQTQAPDDASPEKERSRREKESSPKSDVAGAFQEFWELYPRSVARESARRAFQAAIEGGADPEAIIAGARVYAAARNGEPERYTKHAAGWIKEKRWEDPAPPGAVIDEHGNVVAVEQQADERSDGDDVYSRYLEMAAIAYGGKSW